MAGKIMTAITKMEADTLWSEGNLREAIKLYTDLIASSPSMTFKTRANIEARINLLRDELERPPAKQNCQEVEAAIKKLDKAVSADASVEELREGVKSFYADGLYADAIENLKELIRQNAADEYCVNITAECLIKLHGLEDMPLAVDLFLAESFQHAEKAALFKTLLAEKMGQKGYARQAEVLQRHAHPSKTCSR